MDNPENLTTLDTQDTIPLSNPENGNSMVSMLIMGKVDRGFEPRSDQTEDYKIGIYCFSSTQRSTKEK